MRETLPRHFHLYLFIASLIVGPIVAVYPHLENVNPQHSGVGTDEKFYVDAIRGLENKVPGDVIIGSFKVANGDRPLTILTLFAVTTLSSLSSETVVRYFPVLLAPALSASTYCSIIHAKHRSVNPGSVFDRTKNIAALAASLSPQVVVGIYAGLLANWLALIPALFAMTLSIRLWDTIAKSEEGVNLRKPVVYAVSLVAVVATALLIHVYTWGYVLLTLGVFALISYIALRKSLPRRKILQAILFFAVIISVSIILDLSKSYFTEVLTGAERDFLVVTRMIDLENFAAKWQTLGFTMSQYVGGFLSTPVLLLSSLLWVFRRKQGNSLDRFLYASIVLACIPILLGNTIVQARVLYNIFLFIPTVMLLLNSSVRRQLSIAVIMAMAVYSLRAEANFYLILPEHFELEESFLAGNP